MRKKFDTQERRLSTTDIYYDLFNSILHIHIRSVIDEINYQQIVYEIINQNYRIIYETLFFEKIMFRDFAISFLHIKLA